MVLEVRGVRNAERYKNTGVKIGLAKRTEELFFEQAVAV
jgi:hypothetical protein